MYYEFLSCVLNLFLYDISMLMVHVRNLGKISVE